MRNSNPYRAPLDTTDIQSYHGYLYFVYEREIMRIAKENGYTGELTKDPVLRKYRFTNIRRRDDRMTKWFIKHLIEPNLGDEDLWFTLLIARLINWPPTLQALLDLCVLPASPLTFDPARFSAVVEDCKNDGGKVYGDAYMVYPTKMNVGGCKSESLARFIIAPAASNAAAVRKTLNRNDPEISRFTGILSSTFGISTFIAGQVAADLTYASGHLQGAHDLYTWAPLGPGSQQGLNHLYGRPKFHTWNQRDFNDALMKALAAVERELDITDLTLHDIQSTFCEYGKYARTVLCEGKPKSNYKPQTEY